MILHVSRALMPANDESPEEEHDRKPWYGRTVNIQVFGYPVLVLLIIAIALLVWWIRRAIG